jgi:hypothetical protein
LSAIDDVDATEGNIERSRTSCVISSGSFSNAGCGEREEAVRGERRVSTSRARETRTSDGKRERAEGVKRREKAGRGRDLAWEQ